MSTWISIKEKLPDNHDYLLLFWNSEIDNYEMLDASEAINKYICGVDDEGNDIFSERPYYIEMGVTHWMELPAPPTI
jgi:hypothetical protein